MTASTAPAMSLPKPLQPMPTTTNAYTATLDTSFRAVGATDAQPFGGDAQPFLPPLTTDRLFFEEGFHTHGPLTTKPGGITSGTSGKRYSFIFNDS